MFRTGRESVLSLRERITYWCFDHPARAAVGLYLLTAIPGALLLIVLGQVLALFWFLPVSVVVPVIGYSVWRSGPPEDLRASDR